MAQSKITNVGLDGELVRQLSASISSIPCDRIQIPDNRHRDIDQDKVNDMVNSFVVGGMLHPIIVQRAPEQLSNGYTYLLVAGMHRLVAWRQLFSENKDYHTIPCSVLDAESTSEACEWAELTENVTRNDLTKEQRQSMAGRLAELNEKFGSVKKSPSHENETPTPPTGSLGPTWPNSAKTTGLPSATVQRYWKEFSSDTGHDGSPPSKNHESLWNDFVKWLQGAKERKDESKKEKSEQKHIESICSLLDKRVEKIGVDLVSKAVECWLNDNR